MAENLLLVLTALVVTWVITAFTYQNIMIGAKRTELKNFLSAEQQIPISSNSNLVEQVQLIKKDTDYNVSVYNNKVALVIPVEVKQAFESGYGESISQRGIISSSSVSVAGQLSNGYVLSITGDVAGFGFTFLCIIPALLVAVVISYRMSSSLITNIKFVFKGVILTLERAGNEGGVSVKPSPEILQYEEFNDESREIASLSTQVSQKIKKLYVENKRIDYLLNNMNEGLVVFDRDLRILVINNSAATFFNATGDFKGQNILRLTHLPTIVDALTQVVESGIPVSVDLKSPDEQRTLQVIMSAVHDEYEKTDGVIMLISDVTKIRLAEKIRSEFVANASHELKTPLTSIKGFSELINTGIISDPEKARGYLEHISTETERMIGLINDILKLSELESTAIDTGRVQVSLRLIAQKVCDSLVNQINRKEVKVSVSGDIGSIEAKPQHMEQMLLNLVDNAIKYNKQGGSVKVTVEQNAENVILTVSDTGVGIPVESRERVFERFYRVDMSRSRKLGGTGLGLSIVKHIVGLYKGTILLESEVGVGTFIKVTLPCYSD
jgi:two-component system phosphate regulon sensor histidine kinase PhoR